MVIHFYRAQDAYGCFSNFSRHDVEIDGQWWPTTEHYYQAQKFAGTPQAEVIRQASTPGQAAALGRDRSLPLRAGWEQVKDDVMRVAVRHKFRQHADLRQVLLGTGDVELVEQTRDDYYWGCGADGTGKNMLGQILMEVRAELRGDPDPGSVP